MALNVKFLKGTAAQYSALATKDLNTFYYTTDNNKLYLGTIELSNSDMDTKIGDLANLNTTAKNTIVAAINEVLANEGTLSNLTTTAKGTLVAAINELKGRDDAQDLAIGTIGNLETTATDLVGAVNELKSAIDDLETDSEVTVTTSSSADYAQVYTIAQGGTIIGTINIPKDMVVSSGRVVVDPQGQPAGTYIELILANATQDKLYINVGTLVDIYTAEQSATQVQLAINSSTREISATIVAGSITATELAANAVTTAKIADGNVTTDKVAAKAITNVKLSDEVNASLDLADSAVQSISIGSTNGTISVDGTEVAVAGLGSAAYTDSTAYDTAGAATTAKNEVIGASTDAKTANTIYGAKKYADDAADTAEQNAKDYADGLAGNYATAAQGAKADTAVQSIAEGTANGQIRYTVDGTTYTSVNVHGLGGAAYKAENYYDLAGAATTAENNAKTYVDQNLTWGTIA